MYIGARTCSGGRCRGCREVALLLLVLQPCEEWTGNLWYPASPSFFSFLYCGVFNAGFTSPHTETCAFLQSKSSAGSRSACFCLPSEHLPRRQKARSKFGLQAWLHDWEVAAVPAGCTVFHLCIFLVYFLWQGARSVVKLLTPFSQLTKKSSKWNSFHSAFMLYRDIWILPGHLRWKADGLVPLHLTWAVTRCYIPYVKVFFVWGAAVEAEQLQGRRWGWAPLLLRVTEKARESKEWKDHNLKKWGWPQKPGSGVPDPSGT